MGKSKTHEEYIKEVEIKNPNIEVIGTYVNSDTKIDHRCKKHDIIWSAAPTNILHGSGCRICARRNASNRLRDSDEEYIRKLHDVMPHVDILEPYQGQNVEILHICHICGSTFISKPNNVLIKGHCTVCSGGRIGSAPEYKNSIWASEYRDFFSAYMTEEQMKSTFPKSGKKIDVLCPDCHKIKKISPINLITKGLGCQCGDNWSFANKFVYNVLCQLGLSIKTEYSPSWANKKRYDIFLEDYSLIVENHGKQHYEESTMTTRSLEEEQENDRLKEIVATQNGIDNYVVLDCRESHMAHIKRSILNSQLPVLLRFSETDVDWTKATAYASKSLIKQAAELYTLGHTMKDIAKELCVTRNTITGWLKRANEAGFCEYMPQKQPICVYCINLNKWFSSLEKAYRETGVSPQLIIACCNGEREYVYAKRQKDVKWYWSYQQNT